MYVYFEHFGTISNVLEHSRTCFKSAKSFVNFDQNAPTTLSLFFILHFEHLLTFSNTENFSNILEHFCKNYEKVPGFFCAENSNFLICLDLLSHLFRTLWNILEQFSNIMAWYSKYKKHHILLSLTLALLSACLIYFGTR